MDIHERQEKEEAIEVGDKVYFLEQRSPMIVKARNERYMVLTEKNYRLKDVYHSIVDFQDQWRAPDDRIFAIYNYNKQESIDKCLKDLVEGKVNLSRRRGIKLNIDWGRTEARKAKTIKKKE